MATQRTYHDAVAQAQRLIEENLEAPLELDDLAEQVGLSPFHFHRVFRGLTGETVAGCTRRLRLERAAQSLRLGCDDILDLALRAGYGSHEAFTRAFRRHFGCNPSEFRADRVQAASAVALKEYVMNIRIEQTEPCTIACVRHVGPYTGVAETWGALMKWGWSKMMFGRPQTFGLCHDDPEVTAPEQVRYDACMVVKPGTKVKAPVELRELPAGTYAVVEHAGPYEQLGDTYTALIGQLTAEPVAGQNWQLGDPPAREIYMNDPRKTSPDQLRTEIWMPVRKA